jgi:H+/Cl- antiporter ClcA
MIENHEFILKQIPHEFVIGEVYMPPLLIAAFFGALAAYITVRLLNHYRLSKYFFYPPLVSLSLMVIFTVLIGTFVIGA